MHKRKKFKRKLSLLLVVLLFTAGFGAMFTMADDEIEPEDNGLDLVEEESVEMEEPDGEELDDEEVDEELDSGESDEYDIDVEEFYDENEEELDPEIYDIESMEAGIYNEKINEQLSQEAEPNVLLVKFFPRSMFPGKEKQYQDAVEQVTKWGFDYIEALDVHIVYLEELEKNPNAVLNRFKNNRFIEYVEPNYTGSVETALNDPNYTATAKSYASYINAEAGWSIITRSSVPVAIIDTGYSGNNDLPPARGYNVIGKNSDLTDINGHGTKVAGTLGAIGNNKVGNTGVVWNANIMPVKITESSTITASNVSIGIIWAADNGAKIISLSLVISSDSITLKNAIDYAYNKGCLIVGATGNDGLSTVRYPAAYPNVLAVGATSNGTTRTSISNYGIGLDVLASVMWTTTTNTGSFINASGTSIATPQVAGLAALVWELAPKLTNLQVMDLIRGNTNRADGKWDEQTGYGIIDMGKTLSAAKALGGSVTPPPATTEPATEPPTEPAVVVPPPPKYDKPPTLTLRGSAEITIEVGDSYTEPGYTAVDCLGIDITKDVKVTGTVNTNVPGTNTLTYEVKDAGGNTAKTTRKVIVVAKPIIVPDAPSAPAVVPPTEAPAVVFAPPQIAIVGSNPIVLHLDTDTPYTEQGAVAIDSAEGDISDRVSWTTPVVRDKAGTYTVVYTVTNSQGMSASATRSVIILAPKQTTKARAQYSFTSQGKQGTVFAHKGIVAEGEGTMELKVTKLDNKMTIGVKLIDSDTKRVVLTDSFAAAGTKSYSIASGEYTLEVTISAANGNSTYAVTLTMPEVVLTGYERPEVPMGDLTLFDDIEEVPQPGGVAAEEEQPKEAPNTGDCAALALAMLALACVATATLAHRRRRSR